MRLVTLRHPGATTAAVQAGEGFVAVQGYAHVGALLADGDAGLDAAREALDAGSAVDPETVTLACPVLGAPAVVCVGLNYRTHIEEMGRELPKHPTLFSKLPRALTGPNDPISLPSASNELDYEGELVAVIARAGRDIRVERALDHVAGVTMMNDVTVRDFQWRTTQWFAGKTWQRSTPVGPAVVTLDELPPIGELEMRVTVNGEIRQRVVLDDLVFDVPALVADVSRMVELQPGDLIATGTPGGVGAASKPPRFLADGDIVTVEIDGVGRLENRVVAAAGVRDGFVGASA